MMLKFSNGNNGNKFWNVENLKLKIKNLNNT